MQKNIFLFLGSGIGIYTFSILSGAWISQQIKPFLDEKDMFVYLTAIIIIFISFLFMEWMGKKRNRSDQAFDEMNRELKIAREVQEKMLPQREEFPGEFEVGANLLVAKEVGGDFYDVIRLGNGKTLFVIGDVMGKGLPAAMIMSSVIGQIRSEVHNGKELTDLLKYMNRILIRDSRFSMCVTLGLALIDASTRQLTYASAGHPYPYFLRGRSMSHIEVPSLPLGIDLEAEFPVQSESFTEQDMLVLYTDGIIEAQNRDREMYGFHRFERSLLDHLASGSAEKYCESVISDVLQYTGNKPLEDDFTLVVVQLKKG